MNEYADDGRCLTCQGRVWSVQRAEWVARRETVGMVCQTCGTDYGPPAADAAAEAREQIARWLYHNTGAREDLLDGMADDLMATAPAVAEALAAVERVRALAEELQTLEASRAECRSNLVDLLREKDRLGEAITDLCWKATPYGGGEDVTAYLLPAGTVHRLIGVAQGVGIPAAFRALDGPT